MTERRNRPLDLRILVAVIWVVAAAIFAFGLATLALAFFHVGGGWSGGVLLLLISGVFVLVAIRMPDLWMERLAQRPSRQKRGR